MTDRGAGQDDASSDLEARDPSLGMPHLFYQIKEWKSQTRVLVSPPPYNTGEFELPPYYKA